MATSSWGPVVSRAFNAEVWKDFQRLKCSSVSNFYSFRRLLIIIEQFYDDAWIISNDLELSLKKSFVESDVIKKFLRIKEIVLYYFLKCIKWQYCKND